MKRELKAAAVEIYNRTNGRYALTTYSPGDGVTRYAIGRGNSSEHDYFSDHAVAHALGSREALAVCYAFLAGLDAAR